MLPGPVFNVELLTLSRRRRYFAMRFLYGTFLLYLIWLNYSSISYAVVREGGVLTRQELAMLGMIVFSTFSFTQAIVILLITPALVAGVVADERQRKTLHYLLASCLSSAEIVLGKLAARLLSLAVFVGVGLPIVAILSFLGGVDPNMVLLFFVGCGSTAFLIASASIAVSVHAKKPREAVAVSYILELVWLFGPSIFAATLNGLGGRWNEFYGWVKPINEWVGMSSPFYVMSYSAFMRSGSPAMVYESVSQMIGVQVLYGSLLAVVAVARVRPINRAEGAGSGKWAAAFARGAGRLLPRPACGNDALLWKERYVSRTSPLAKIVGGFVFLVVVALLVYSTYLFAKPAYLELLNYAYGTPVNNYVFTSFNGYLRAIVTTVAACWMIGTASAASSCLTSEREADTWISLISTPLTPFEIVRAKMFGALWSLRWLGLLWLVLVLTGLFLGAVHPFGFLAVGVVTGVYLWFAAALGMFFSLRSRSSGRSLVATIATLIVLNGGYTLFLIPISAVGPEPFLGVTPFVSAMALMSYSDVNSLLSGSMTSGADMVLTTLTSITVYTLAALGVTTYLVMNFDDCVDRPRTSGDVPRNFQDVRFKRGKPPRVDDLFVIKGSGEDEEPVRPS